MRQGIVIFRIQLLPPSETFVETQAGAMQTFEPYFVGWRRVEGIEIPENRRWTVDSGGSLGKLRELRFRYLGPTPSEIARLHERAPTLMYAHFALDGHAALGLAKKLGVPLVTALHGYDVTMSDEAIGATRLGREYLKGRKTLQQEGALFVACSAYVRSRAIERGYPPERTIVHAIGVDVNKFSSPISPQREDIVLFVGRLVEKKGCAVLIEAMAEVQRSCPEAELVVIGDGPLRAACEARAAIGRLRCRFLGAQQPSVVQEWMARARVFCVPSMVAASGDAEGFGIVFIEAQAMGLPVVSTRSGGIPEAVGDGDSGLLVAEGESGALAEAIVKLLQDNDLWRRFSVAGRKRVLERFDVAKQTERLEGIFEDLSSFRKVSLGPDERRRTKRSDPGYVNLVPSVREGQMAFTRESLSRSNTNVDRRRADSGSIN